MIVVAASALLAGLAEPVALRPHHTAVKTGADLVAVPRGPAQSKKESARTAPSVRSGSATWLSPGTDAGVWSTFVRVEDEVAARGHAVTHLEGQINALASQVQGSPRPDLQADRLGSVERASLALIRLAKDRQQEVSGYQASLQREYEFFLSVAENAMLRVALRDDAALTPAARSVVDFDLDAVTSQLRQEQAVAVAESATAAPAKPELPLLPRRPQFVAPVGGVVTQGFGVTSLVLEPSTTYHGVLYQHFHTGIDIANVLDTPVGAAAAGRVILAGSNSDAAGTLVGYGNYVVIQHGGGYISLYGHLDQIVVTTGQLVQAGQEIGLLGTTGWSTGPHLHFEIRLNGGFLNPELLLGAAVRP